MDDILKIYIIWVQCIYYATLIHNTSILYVFIGEPIIDEIFYVLLSTGMLVGGAAAFFMDNTIPGKNNLHA